MSELIIICIILFIQKKTLDSIGHGHLYASLHLEYKLYHINTLYTFRSDFYIFDCRSAAA